MALVTGLKRLIEKELQGEHNPVACAEEEIYSGPLNPGSKIEIIIPRIGDLIQELHVINVNPTCTLNIFKAYIETINDDKMIIKWWPLHIFKTFMGLKLICDYEVNLLKPYQVTKLIIISDNRDLLIKKNEISIIAYYIFVDINARRNLIENK